MLKSFKNYSRAVNVLVFVAGLVSFLGVDGLKGFVPVEYQYLIPTVVMVAGYVLVQLSEDKRVERAESIAVSQSGGCLNAEYDSPIE